MNDIRTESRGKLYFNEERLEKALKDASGENEITVKKEGVYIITFLNNGRTYNVTSDGEIKDIVTEIADETPNEIKQKDETTYVIQSIEDLVILSQNVRRGDSYIGKTFELECTLDFNNENSYIDANSTVFGDINNNGRIEILITELTTGMGFVPIGDWTTLFEGNINGNSNGIENLYIKRDEQPIGFIGKGKNNIIKNLRLGNVNIEGNNDASGLIGELSGESSIIDNCYISGKVKSISSYAGGVLGDTSNDSKNMKIKIVDTINEAIITGKSNVGGLVGRAAYLSDIEIENCKNKSKIIATQSYCGGIIGATYYLSGSVIIRNCTNLAEIEIQNEGKAGGIIGSCTGDSSSNTTKAIIENCSNSATINSKGNYIGGVIGEFYDIKQSQVTSCYNIGNIKIQDGTWTSMIGGIVGRIEKGSQVSLCYNTGNIEASEGNKVGGIVGTYEGTAYENAKIEKSYNKGNIYAKGYVAGIIGNKIDNTEIPVECCYNEGNITAVEYVGGIAGYAMVKITNCYNKGDITATKSDLGGIAAYINAIVENTYNTGTITGIENARSGGIIGSGQKVKDSYNFGKINIPTGNSYTGAIAGCLYSRQDTSTCYYLTSTYNVGVGNGTYTTNSEDNIDDLKEIMNNKFSLISEWKIDTKNHNGGYPMLDI